VNELRTAEIKAMAGQIARMTQTEQILPTCLKSLSYKNAL